jgi:drug/metabolite transporter (DMT)-like permease
MLVGMNLFWAGTYPTFKVLGRHLDSGSIATVRYTLAAVILLAAWRWLPGRGPRGIDLWRAGLMGFLVFCVAPRLQIEGVHRSQAGDTSLLMALEPLITAVAAAVFLSERIAPRRWWGCLLGMIGVVLMSRMWHADAAPLAGLAANLLFVSSFLAETAYSVMGKPLLARSGSLKLLAVAVAAGTVSNVATELALGHAPRYAALGALPLQAWLLFGYLALICTIAGYALWYLVIRDTEVNVTALTVFVQPVAGLSLSVVWLGESLHAGQLWGSAAIAVGLAIGLRRGRPLAEAQVPAGP